MDLFQPLATAPATHAATETEMLGANGTREGRPPTLQARHAVGILQGRSDIEVKAWLAFARSIEPDFRPLGQSSYIPNNQVNAVSILKDWQDEAILRWLRWARRRGDQQPTTQNERNCRRYFNGRNDLLPASFADTFTSTLSPNPYRIITALGSKMESDRDSNSTEVRTRKRKAGNSDHRYWCTICGPKNSRSYQSSDDWKKHEKEHETTFNCLPCGLLEDSGRGPTCAFCGELEPDDDHLHEHNVERCLNFPQGPPSFKRRYEMVSHLKEVHRCIDSEALAERWRSVPHKQAWSCGFCVAVFSSLPERLKHIGVEHFDRRQPLSDWDPSKVIQGLLLQPEIKEAWQSFLNTLDPLSRQDLSWNNGKMADLQRRLEMGVTESESAETLAQAAYNFAEFDWSSNIVVSTDAGDSISGFMAPPPIAKRARPLHQRDKFGSKTSTTNIDSTKSVLPAPISALPASISATQSCHLTSASPAHWQDLGFHATSTSSFTDSSQESWTETYHRDNGGLATPFSNCSSVIHGYPSPQSFWSEEEATGPDRSLKCLEGMTE